MRKVLYVSLILCIAVLLYAGCKNKTRDASIPLSIFRVTYSDADQGGTVNAGDQLFIQFDRHVTVVTSNAVAFVFELASVSDDFGTGATWVHTSGHAVTVTLGTGAALTVDGSDIITSQIRFSETIPFGAIRDAAWLTSVGGGGFYVSMEGRLGYAAPILLSAIYDDVDVSGTLTENDTITLTFTGAVSTYVGNYWPWLTFIVPVNWDNLGTGAFALQTDVDEITITIGSGNPDLQIPGTHTVGNYVGTAPSGIDIAISMPAARITFDAGGVDINVPPTAVDIQ